MVNQFGADIFFVKSNGGAYVPAKYLMAPNGSYVMNSTDVTANPKFTKYIQDASGNYIVDPGAPASGAQPYIVPGNYNPADTISKYQSLYANVPRV